MLLFHAAFEWLYWRETPAPQIVLRYLRYHTEGCSTYKSPRSLSVPLLLVLLQAVCDALVGPAAERAEAQDAVQSMQSSTSFVGVAAQWVSRPWDPSRHGIPPDSKEARQIQGDTIDTDEIS